MLHRRNKELDEFQYLQWKSEKDSLKIVHFSISKSSESKVDLDYLLGNVQFLMCRI